MSFLKNTVSLLALFSVIPAAYAVTARPSVINSSTARRMPTMTAFITGATGSTTTTGGSSTTSSTLLANAECIDAYTQCIKGGDACGSGLEECTTKVLFHGKMPQCLSTLAQCSSSGVNSLFGTSNISALNTVATKNTYGEITEYTYPTDGSVLGQMISAAAIENKYDTSACVRRYSSCLRKDSVCGNDFELCTTNSEFKKQRVFCDSTLARCQGDGLLELFGTASMTATPSASSRIGEMIAEGAALAAVNAVSTCYKVVDQCILNACTANPYKCYENSTAETVELVDAINNGADVATNVDVTQVISKSDVSAYIKNSCQDTIGSNKYCYATFIGDGQMPTSSQLRDEDNQEEIYDLAYGARYNSGMKAKITDLVNKFDTRAKEKCIETIKSCAMRVCGGGSGAACYAQVFGDTDKSINNEYSRNEIKTGCQAIVNTDANCKYAAQNPNETGTYNYSFIQADAFDTLFPEYDVTTNADPIGVIASLNSALANNYSDAALAQMKKQCQSVATSCVRANCGSDFVNCYRNRTDIYSSLTNSDDDEFDKSMNKVGGVLDYTIVLGLCIDTVKNADVCSEHLAIEANKYKIDNSRNTGWGTTGSVRSEWIDAGGTSKMAKMEGTTEPVQATDENGNNLCSDKCGNQGICYTASTDASCGTFETPVMMSFTTYVETQAANTLFKDLIYDLEIEAQAKYNAKITKQQNMCTSSNNGGIIGKNDMGSTFLWAKLRGGRVPANYSVAGLKPSQFVASNDLYGSFCRVRVTLQSDDREINQALLDGASWSTAYFAAGDTFTCGSWIPTSELETLANKVAKEARAERKERYGDMQDWITVLGTVGGGVGGSYLGAGIQSGDVFSGLTGKIKKDSKKSNNSQKAKQEAANKCVTSANLALDSLSRKDTVSAESALNAAANQAISAGVDGTTIANARNAISTTPVISNSSTQVSGGKVSYSINKDSSAGYWLMGPCENTKTLGKFCKDLGRAEQAALDSGKWTEIKNLEKQCRDAYNAFRKQDDWQGQKGSNWENYNDTVIKDIITKDAENMVKVVDQFKSYAQDLGVNMPVFVKTCNVAHNSYTSFTMFIDASVYNEPLEILDYTGMTQGTTNNVFVNTSGTTTTVNTNAINTLRAACEVVANDTTKEDEKSWWEKSGGATIGAVVGSVAGGILAHKAIGSIQDQELNSVERAAYNEFMDSVGSKIRCFIGPDEVGMYGEMISTSME